MLTREGTTRQAVRRRIEERAARERRGALSSRRTEFVWLIAASLIAATGFALVYQAKSKSQDENRAVNVNEVTAPAQLLPLLSEIPNPAARLAAANRIVAAVHKRKVPNDGALARTGAVTAAQLRNIKPFLVVRSPAQFRNWFFLCAALFFISFFGVHIFWRYTGFAGDNLILPVIELLCAVGLMLMVSLRDPLRDTLLFRDFTEGIAAGCIAMALFSRVDYGLRFKPYSFIFLLATLLLGLLLAVFGHGPGTSDAKVTLFFFEPVEIMRILIVLFLAAYFAEHWDLLRDLKRPRRRLVHVMPVAVGVAASILMFFGLRDNGPALVIGCAFLLLYAIARKHAAGALLGLALIAVAFWIGHGVRFPANVADRVDMWESPWRNTVHGGDQVAQSAWALSTGAAWGTGLGLGSPAFLPAGHNDLILSAVGEELGFAGLACIFLLYAVLIWRSLRIALRSSSPYSYFLAAGLTLIVSLQLILIAGGLLDLIPLSGVVSPFLSAGRTSMAANFVIFAIILAISDHPGAQTQARSFAVPTYWAAGVLIVCGVAILGRAAYFQVVKPDEFVVKDAEVRYADRTLGLEYNPRLREILEQVPKGDILDRNGLPLATNNWNTVQQNRTKYTGLGVNLDQTASPSEARHYPLGPEFFYLVGDVRTSLRRGATNTAFAEKQERVRLQGFDDRRAIVELRDPASGDISNVYQYDYSDLVPVLRHRHEPENPEVKAFTERQRDVRMSIDAALQLRASAILKSRLEKLGLKKGAIVILDPANGDLLASVSYPWPEAWQFASFRANPDRAMEAEFQDRARFGRYPPGSSFKIVTAIAALRIDPALEHQTYECKALGDGRVGNYVGNSKRPVRDDVRDTVPHGTVDMAKGIVVSCNAYFAQLGFYKIGASALLQTAQQFGILAANPNTPAKLREFLAQASYGQGQVVASPFQMARVAATVAASGKMPQGRWILDESNIRIDEPVSVLSPELMTKIAADMRGVVTSGTATVLRNSPIPIAGKTGTAELANAPAHAWFIGYAPYRATGGKQVAFAILVENGRYGGTAAAPMAVEIVEAARQAGLL